MNTLRRTITRSLTRGLFLFAVICAGVGSYAAGGGFDMAPPASDADVMAIRPAAEGSPSALIAANDCWTDEAPADMAGVIPGHVVATRGNGETVVGGSGMVGKALAQIFDGADHGLTVHGFCR